MSIAINSFGSYLHTILTEKRKVKNLVLTAPAIYINDLFEKPQMKNTGENPDVFNWRLGPQKIR